MGFCLLNNVAIAAQRALDAHGAGRVLVLDWDVHHGNGTNDIFHATRRRAVRQHPRVAAVSGQRAGVGRRQRARARASRSTCRCRAGRATRRGARSSSTSSSPLARSFEPGLVLVSAGLRRARRRPAGDVPGQRRRLRGDGRVVRRFAAELGAPVGVVLEGGYDVDALARSFVATARGVRRGRRARRRSTSRGIRWPTPRLARLAGRWPALALSALATATARVRASGSAPSGALDARRPVVPSVVVALVAGASAPGRGRRGLASEPLAAAATLSSSVGDGVSGRGGRRGRRAAGRAGGVVAAGAGAVLAGSASGPRSGRRTTTASAARASAATRAADEDRDSQRGVGATRVRAAWPQLRHQSCSGGTAAPQRAQASVPGGAAGGASGVSALTRGSGSRWAAARPAARARPAGPAGPGRPSSRGRPAWCPASRRGATATWDGSRISRRAADVPQPGQKFASGSWSVWQRAHAAMPASRRSCSSRRSRSASSSARSSRSIAVERLELLGEQVAAVAAEAVQVEREAAEVAEGELAPAAQVAQAAAHAGAVAEAGRGRRRAAPARLPARGRPRRAPGLDGGSWSW